MAQNILDVKSVFHFFATTFISKMFRLFVMPIIVNGFRRKQKCVENSL